MKNRYDEIVFRKDYKLQMKAFPERVESIVRRLTELQSKKDSLQIEYRNYLEALNIACDILLAILKEKRAVNLELNLEALVQKVQQTSNYVFFDTKYVLNDLNIVMEGKGFEIEQSKEKQLVIKRINCANPYVYVEEDPLEVLSGEDELM